MFLSVVLFLALSTVAVAPATIAQRTPIADESENWVDETPANLPPQTGAGELRFLDPPPAGGALHSQNWLSIARHSLTDGWVELKQCYRGLDPVPDMEVVYRYKDMRGLHIQSMSNIGQAYIEGQSVQLVDVRKAATLCITAEARILYRETEGGYVLRNGPFHRRFLDSFFPYHVTLDIRYPVALLRYVDNRPAAQGGFRVQQEAGYIHIDSWFAGELIIEVRFARVEPAVSLAIRSTSE